MLLSLAGLFFSAPLLTVERTPTSAEAIIVLSGDPVLRPQRAVELYRDLISAQHPSPSPLSINPQSAILNPHSISLPAPLLVLASGIGDCETIARVLAAAGVPTNAFVLECASRSTWENAAFSLPLLREHRATNVIIVTSWFHSRRALNCFQKQAPDLHFISMPTVTDRPRAGWPNEYDRSRVLLEYAKSLVYWFRYGVCPW